jgi:methyl-accepting chemotaxis protein
MQNASRNKDLTLRSEVKGSDEVSTMAAAFNDMMETFHDMLTHVVNTSSEVHAAAEQLSTINNRTAEGVHRQHGESDQVSTAMNEMSATVGEVSKQAQDAANASSTADHKASEGKQIVADNNRGIQQLASQIENTSSAIHQLSDESNNIGTVLQVIRDIAEQTNLLALNAAIEAARAGEQGRGFAVVADEVRNLAQRSHNSTDEIQDIVERLQQKARDAVSAMNSGQAEANSSVERAELVGQTLDSILSEITAINNMNTQIAAAAEEQASVAEEINRSIIEIAQISNQTAEGATEATNTSNNLTSMSEQLNNLVSQFKL